MRVTSSMYVLVCASCWGWAVPCACCSPVCRLCAAVALFALSLRGFIHKVWCGLQIAVWLCHEALRQCLQPKTKLCADLFASCSRGSGWRHSFGAVKHVSFACGPIRVVSQHICKQQLVLMRGVDRPCCSGQRWCHVALCWLCWLWRLVRRGRAFARCSGS